MPARVYLLPVPRWARLRRPRAAGRRGKGGREIGAGRSYSRELEVAATLALQMVTADAPNVFVYRCEGDTDEQAQALKLVFSDAQFMSRHASPPEGPGAERPEGRGPS